MKLNRFILRLLSPVGTPWRSDTMVGHLLWQAARRDEALLEELLTGFRAGDPPFVLSDGFPRDLLAKPLIPAHLLDENVAPDDARIWSRGSFLPFDVFSSFCRGESFPVTSTVAADSAWVSVKTLHATLDREAGTTAGEEGNLHETYAEVLDPKTFGGILHLYAWCAGGWDARLRDLFDGLAKTGFGRDKSTGLGAFEVAGVDEVELKDPVEPDSFVSLSSFVPRNSDPCDGFWKVRLKRGKLGEERSLSGNPFKRPMFQLEAGSIFRVKGQPRPWYGKAVENIAPGAPEAIQAGFALAIPCLFPARGA